MQKSWSISKHGFNIHVVVFDEMRTQPNRKLFDVNDKRQKIFWQEWDLRQFLLDRDSKI